MSTKAAVMTPQGLGAVASIGVWGERALPIVAGCFQPASRVALEQLPARRITFGRWRSTSEEVVVCCFSSQRVEIHCHGGVAPARSVIRDLLAHGCQQGHPADALEELPPLSRLAAQSLSAAATRRTAAILLDQFHGALEIELRTLKGTLDRGNRGEALGILSTLLDQARCGPHLVEPWQLVILGQPNVGKSSLLNTLVGFERALVFDQPGTTRDVLTVHASIDGWPVEFADTAGIRQAADTIEAEGIRRASARTATADLIILVSDLSREWSRADAELLASVGVDECLLVHNKADLPRAAGDRPAGIEVSCQSRAGIPALFACISRRLIPNPPKQGAAVPFTTGLISALESAMSHCRASRLAAAQRLVEQVLGWQPEGQGG